MLRVIDQTFPQPEENLAFDDRLLESGRGTLRFWESPAYFVVLGRSGRTYEEVDAVACRTSGIPILRRSSGGGTVLQGPGCLNYTLVLSLSDWPALGNVIDSYRIILNRVAAALGVPLLEVRGSDLVLRSRKVSGNAQRRTRGWLLHHGTLLYGLDVSLMESLLLEPNKRPPHRQGRLHREFVTMLDLRPEEMKRRIVSGWTQFAFCA